MPYYQSGSAGTSMWNPQGMAAQCMPLVLPWPGGIPALSSGVTTLTLTFAQSHRLLGSRETTVPVVSLAMVDVP